MAENSVMSKYCKNLYFRLKNLKFLAKWIISLKMERQSFNRDIHYYYYYFSTDEETEEQRETCSDSHS